jgi:RNA polymerase sigma-70 factor (ECF subfamily)
MQQSNSVCDKVTYLLRPPRQAQDVSSFSTQQDTILDTEQLDTNLLRLISERSTTALMQFYQRYNKIILSFAMSHFASEPDCREILNDVLLAIWSSASGFVGRSSVRTWVLGITHHKTMDHLRKQQRDKRTRTKLDLEQQSFAPEDHVAQTMAALDSAKTVRKCLQQLSPTHREVLHLAFYEDLSCSEIAEVLECPLGTVKTRLMHAKNKLKQLLSLHESAEAIV